MRKGELIFNYTIMLGPLVIGLGAAWAMDFANSIPRTTFWVMNALFLSSFVMFAKAKWSVIKQGHLLTFGPAKMSKQNRYLYFIGYVGMVLGLILLVGFVLAAR